MNASKRRDLPAGLAGVQRRFERWRHTRRGHARIPDALWAAAVKATGRHGLHRTVRALRLAAADPRRCPSCGEHRGRGTTGGRRLKLLLQKPTPTPLRATLDRQRGNHIRQLPQLRVFAACRAGHPHAHRPTQLPSPTAVRATASPKSAAFSSPSSLNCSSRLPPIANPLVSGYTCLDYGGLRSIGYRSP
jgi:hypothetical protein